MLKKSLKYEVWGKDPFRTKSNRKMGNKDIYWCYTRTGSRDGNFSLAFVYL